MRKKIKQLMNKEEGFTLVELLAVIVILGIIVAIAIPSIGNLIDNAGTEAEAAEKTLVVDAARLWEIQDGKELTNEDALDPLTVKDLIDEGFLEMRDSEMIVATSTVVRDSATKEITVDAKYPN